MDKDAVTNLNDCIIAAASSMINLPFVSSFSNIPDWPVGCFVYTGSNTVYFNNDSVGSNNGFARQICVSLGKEMSNGSIAINLKNFWFRNYVHKLIELHLFDLEYEHLCNEGCGSGLRCLSTGTCNVCGVNSGQVEGCCSTTPICDTDAIEPGIQESATGKIAQCVACTKSGNSKRIWWCCVYS